MVVAGERKELMVQLEKRGIVSKWWFWAGVGAVVVVGGAVITYAVLTERPAPQGDGFQPGQLSAPLRW